MFQIDGPRMCVHCICFSLFFRRLQPAFTPQKVREKIKREPVFHDELLENEPEKVRTLKM